MKGFHWLCCALLASGCLAAKPETAPRDPLSRDTPRDAIHAFLEACHDGKYVRAARYLDLSRIPNYRQPAQGPELARQLGLLLDRDTDFEVEQLDHTPDGKSGDGLASDMDRLASFPLNGRQVTLFLQREEENGATVWVVAPDSVARIPQWISNSQGPPIEKVLPAPLVSIKLLGTPLWTWIGLVLLGLLLSVLSKALSKAAVALVKPFAKRYAAWMASYRVETFTEPLRLLVSIAVFRVAMEAFSTSALLRDYLFSVLLLLAVAGAASVLMRVVDVASDRMIARLDVRERALSFSVFPIGVRFVKICIFCVAILVVLDQWGVRITTILAGLGVGGLAVALAAQKTLENLFGGISILSDRPVLVGDVCQFGGQTGVVADIGLRSTRIRTPERTLVTIPNAQFSTMTLENLSLRDRMLFKPALQLRRDTSPGQIRAFMDAVENMLRQHPKVDAAEVPVRFTDIAPASYRLEVFAYIATTDADEFLTEQTGLLLRILDLAEELSVQFAVPFQEVTVAPSDPPTAAPPEPRPLPESGGAETPDSTAMN